MRVPIHAVSNGNLEQVKVLIASGVNVDLLIKNADTALIVASREGHLEIVKFLIAAGVDIDRDLGSETALIAAS